MRHFLAFIFFVTFIHSLLYAKPLRHQRLKRNALRDESRLWPNAVVPYKIDEAYSAQEREIIERAMEDIHSVSCIRFQKLSGEKSYVEIVKGDKCSAKVGYTGRRREMTLNPNCIQVHRVLHELFHVLGFFHEHARPDRDNYVIVHKHNIRPDAKGNFNKKSPYDVTSFGLPYDFHSVLHYPAKEFAINRSQLTLEPIIGKPILHKPRKMSEMDILKLNKLYRCPEHKTEIDALKEG